MDKKHDETRSNIGKMQSDSTKVSAESVSQSREQNTVFGIAENPEWRKKLTDALGVVAGREVLVWDTFRIGRFDEHRPIIVKLRNIWDKRLLINNSLSLSSCTVIIRAMSVLFPTNRSKIDCRFNPSAFFTPVSCSRHSVRPAHPSGARQACVRRRSTSCLEQSP